MPKISRTLRSCSMKIFSTFPNVNISKLNYWLVICIAKNFIWTTLKMIFLIFIFFCTLRFQIFKYCPIITNHASMEKWFIQLQMMHTSALMTGVVAHSCTFTTSLYVWYFNGLLLICALLLLDSRHVKISHKHTSSWIQKRCCEGYFRNVMSHRLQVTIFKL